jgi:hypothetical protein
VGACTGSSVALLSALKSFDWFDPGAEELLNKVDGVFEVVADDGAVVEGVDDFEKVKGAVAGLTVSVEVVVDRFDENRLPKGFACC